MSQVKPSLKAVLKRLKLSGLVDTLPDRAAYAQKAALTPFDFLELALQEEIDRRENKNLVTRLDRVGSMKHTRSRTSTGMHPSRSTVTA